MRVIRESKMTIWEDVDRYLADLLVPKDSVLEAALAANAAANLPSIEVSPTQGKLLYLLARVSRARNVLEIGTLGGYSTIWLARALPGDGRVITLEGDPLHAAIARSNIARSGLGDRVDIRVGTALETLPTIEAEGLAPFDMIFIDADWISHPAYVEWSLRLSRPGTLVIVDNVVHRGAIVDKPSGRRGIEGTRRMLKRLAREPRLSATAIQTVGRKGYDGFVMAVVNDDPARARDS